MPDPVETLRTLITSTSVSLSPVVAWVVFAFGVLSREREHYAEFRQKLREVMKELDYMGTWARNQYTDEDDNPNWGNPLWSVNDFPSDRIHEFNQSAYDRPVDARLREALADLETAIERFRMLLRAHRHFIMLDNGRLTMAVAANPQSAPREWWEELHRLNRAIHIDGIGTANNPNGLHSTWTVARTEVQRAIDQRGKRRHPRSLWFGHIPAAILAVIGIGFLIGFINELLHALSWTPWPR